MSLLIVSTANAAGSIVLKLMGVNPSKEQSQTVILKAFLPQEIKPANVINREDMELIYDTKEGSYYVYGEYELQPSEVMQREIELEDIWVISGEELVSLRSEINKTSELLQNTDFKERVEFLRDSIISKIDKIEEIQSVPAINSQKHISAHRDNLKLLAELKNDLVVTRSLLAKAKAMPTVTVWKIFMTVVGFLTVLALLLYFVWHKQVKTMLSTSPYEDEQSEEEITPEQFESKKEGAAGDIEDMLNE
jgi:hypothetical protein